MPPVATSPHHARSDSRSHATETADTRAHGQRALGRGRTAHTTQSAHAPRRTPRQRVRTCRAPVAPAAPPPRARDRARRDAATLSRPLTDTHLTLTRGHAAHSAPHDAQIAKEHTHTTTQHTYARVHTHTHTRTRTRTRTHLPPICVWGACGSLTTTVSQKSSSRQRLWKEDGYAAPPRSTKCVDASTSAAIPAQRRLCQHATTAPE